MKRWIPISLMVLLGLCLAVCPANAGEKYVLSATSAKVAAGSGTPLEISNIRDVTVLTNVTAGSGTVTLFEVWIEISADGLNFWPITCEVIKNTTAAPAASARQRSIVHETSVQTAMRTTAQCTTQGSLMRAAWNITGSTPSETFSVLAIQK